MIIFDPLIDELKKALQVRKSGAEEHVFETISAGWKRQNRGCLVMARDTAIELGHPTTDSLFFPLVTSTPQKIEDGKITLIGKDIPALKKSPVSFADILLVETEAFGEDQTSERFFEIDMVRHRLNLEGYMLRATTQKMREWSRVSRQAIEKGFSFQVLGSEMINAYHRIGFVRAAEILFITENEDLIRQLTPLGRKVTDVTRALNTIFDKLEFDCDTCTLKDVCAEIEGLKALHVRTVSKKNQNLVHHSVSDGDASTILQKSGRSGK
ncbi:hypothetical protein ACFL27_06285 [candidate division CSSED10-310 bacterium]|uniref:CO-methylating acetyl-CoA synthase n=1 Tax=candidate division CSSED10-310 bacterium TaxID=2855610 RepID=A0ABV6YUB3_UNCC1